MNDLQKYGVTIYLNGEDEVDLVETLQITGESGKRSNWKLQNIECIGDTAETLHSFSDQKKEISGIEFYNLVSNIHQTIDGSFEAYNPNETSHWLLIRAVDGTEFDIETEDLELLKRIRYSFRNVKDLIY